MVFHKFHVKGYGVFPVDMLRYDQCFPATSEDVLKLADSIRGKTHTTELTLISVTRYSQHQIPTVERWRSYGWVATHEKSW